jgi:hypothetical protein
VGVVGWSVSSAAGGHFERGDLPPLCVPDGPPKSPEQIETGIQRQNDARRQRWRLAIERSCSALIKEERKIAHLDALSGDGDCGETMRRAAEAILAALNGGQLGLSSPAQLAQTLANALDGKVGGTSGALYGILFTSASNCARQIGDSADMPASDWGKMLMAGEGEKEWECKQRRGAARSGVVLDTCFRFTRNSAPQEYHFIAYAISPLLQVCRP